MRRHFMPYRMDDLYAENGALRIDAAHQLGALARLFIGVRQYFIQTATVEIDEIFDHIARLFVVAFFGARDETFEPPDFATIDRRAMGVAFGTATEFCRRHIDDLFGEVARCRPFAAQRRNETVNAIQFSVVAD